MTCLFHSLHGDFYKAKVLDFCKVQITFFLMVHAFSIVSKNSFSNLRTYIFSTLFFYRFYGSMFYILVYDPLWVYIYITHEVQDEVHIFANRHQIVPASFLKRLSHIYLSIYLSIYEGVCVFDKHICMYLWQIHLSYICIY